MSKRNLVYQPTLADRRKHKEDWNQPEAGVVRDVDGRPVGKCPHGMDLAVAQVLLDEGIRYAGRNPRSPFPEVVYNVHKGVPFKAHQKGAGKYHGFPEFPSNIPPDIAESLRKRAEDAGDLDAFEEWAREVEDDDAES